MSFWSKVTKFGRGVAKVAAPVVLATVQPEAMLNTAVGLAAKHTVAKLPNNAIPYLNLGISTAVCYAKGVASLGWEGALVPALQEGGALAAVSTALHQSLKLPTRDLVNINGQSL